MIDISEMDDGQVHSLAKELALVVSEKNLFVGAQFMADLEDALLEIREGIKERLAEPHFNQWTELDYGDGIESEVGGGVLLYADYSDGKEVRSQVMLYADPYDDRPRYVVLPKGVKIIREQDVPQVKPELPQSITRLRSTIMARPVKRPPTTTQGQDGRVAWTLLGNGVLGEVIPSGASPNTVSMPLSWGTVEVSGGINLEEFNAVVKKITEDAERLQKKDDEK